MLIVSELNPFTPFDTFSISNELLSIGLNYKSGSRAFAIQDVHANIFECFQQLPFTVAVQCTAILYIPRGLCIISPPKRDY
jgi:hypothetical protein